MTNENTGLNNDVPRTDADGLDKLAERARNVRETSESEIDLREAPTPEASAPKLRAEEATSAREAAVAGVGAVGASDQFVKKIADAAAAEAGVATMPPTIINEPIDNLPATIDLTDDDTPTSAADDAEPPNAELPVVVPPAWPPVRREEDRKGFPIAGVAIAGLLLACIAAVALVVLNGNDPVDTSVDTQGASDADTIDAADADSANDDGAESPSTTAIADANGKLTINPTLSMREALEATGEATQFLRLTRVLELDDGFEAMTTENGVSVRRTLFAPTDEAFAMLSPARQNHLAVNADAAATLIGYHMLEDELTAEQLVGTLGNPLVTQLGLRMTMSVDGDDVLVNGTSRIVVRNIQADNGMVHLIDVVLDPPTVNEAIGLENIEFIVDTSTMSIAGENELRKALNFLRQHDINITIEGHTDTDGSPAMNAALSQARADAVRDFLINNGIEADRLTAVGYGETQPILVDEVENKAASRRIEFVVG